MSPLLPNTPVDGEVEPAAPAAVYWFELRRDKEKGVQFIPHLLDDDSGVGDWLSCWVGNGVAAGPLLPPRATK